MLEKAALFEERFPQSSLRLPVCELAAKAWRAKGDATRATAAAERGLSIAPDYVPLLVEVADLLANGSQQFDRAEQTARHALEMLTSAKAPLRVTSEDWVRTVSGYRASAHGALGMVYFKRGDTPTAIQEFQAALGEAPDDALWHYRLGRVYGVNGRTAEARDHLRKALRSTDKMLRERAQAALADLR